MTGNNAMVGSAVRDTSLAAPPRCGCGGGEAVVLLPQSDYAPRLIEVLWRTHGVRSIAVSRNWRERLLFEHRYPVLRSEAVSAHYVLGSRSIERLALTMRRNHDVVAVIPHHEATIVPLSELAAALQLPWAQPTVLPLFRDKAALKAHIRRVDPSLRITRSQRVTSADEVQHLLEQWGVERVVVKPNDGSGNTAVGFLDATATTEDIAAHLSLIAGPTVVEEYVGGDEHYVDGQVDHRGEPRILSVHRYRKIPVHGKPNVSVGAASMTPEEDTYQQLAAYAARVMRATGVRRVPFHLEVKVDEQGPSLIEVAARMVGFGAAALDSHLSGVDVFELAAHYFLHDWAFPSAYEQPPDPPVRSAAVLGVSDGKGRMHAVAGVDEVESLPAFFTWSRRPEEGLHVKPTVDLESTPWAALLLGASTEELDAAAAMMRQLVSWDVDAVRLRHRAAEVLRRTWRARPRLFMVNTRPLARGVRP